MIKPKIDDTVNMANGTKIGGTVEKVINRTTLLINWGGRLKVTEKVKIIDLAIVRRI